MIKPIRIQATVRFDRVRKGRKLLRIGEAATPAPSHGRVPRVARLLALATGRTQCGRETDSTPAAGGVTHPHGRGVGEVAGHIGGDSGAE
jgi:hypothetical protein